MQLKSTDETTRRAEGCLGSNPVSDQLLFPTGLEEKKLHMSAVVPQRIILMTKSAKEKFVSASYEKKGNRELNSFGKETVNSATRRGEILSFGYFLGLGKKVF